MSRGPVGGRGQAANGGAARGKGGKLASAGKARDAGRASKARNASKASKAGTVDNAGEVASAGTTPITEPELEELARAARDRAYAPYSNFRVGAALVTADGRVFTGANVENASYGLTVCAERNAVMAMVLAGATDVRAIYVASDIAPPASPCGMCRQTLLEFARHPETTRVIVISPQGDHDGWTLAELIPHGFTGDELARPRPAAARRPALPRRTKAL